MKLALLWLFCTIVGQNYAQQFPSYGVAQSANVPQVSPVPFGAYQVGPVASVAAASGPVVQTLPQTQAVSSIPLLQTGSQQTAQNMIWPAGVTPQVVLNSQTQQREPRVRKSTLATRSLALKQQQQADTGALPNAARYVPVVPQSASTSVTPVANVAASSAYSPISGYMVPVSASAASGSGASAIQPPAGGSVVAGASSPGSAYSVNVRIPAPVPTQPVGASVSGSAQPIGGSVAPLTAKMMSGPLGSPTSPVPASATVSFAAPLLYTPPTTDPCLVALDPCSCYLLGGACGWSTTMRRCDSVSNTDCTECPFMPTCVCVSGSACGCAKLGPPCGWSRTARACLKGHTTDCDECSDQTGCPPGHPLVTDPPSPMPTQKPTPKPTNRPPSPKPTASPTPAPNSGKGKTNQNANGIEVSPDNKEIVVRWVYHPKPFSTVYGSIGQSLHFMFNSNHDVWAFRTLEAYETCNFSHAVQQADTDIGGGVAPWTNSFQVLFDRPGILLFACAQDDHCRNGNMKLRVEVAAS